MSIRKPPARRDDIPGTEGLQMERLPHGTVIVHLSRHDASAIRAIAKPRHEPLLEHLRSGLALDLETPIEVDIGPSEPRGRSPRQQQCR
jgi:hypothetical protein